MSSQTGIRRDALAGGQLHSLWRVASQLSPHWGLWVALAALAAVNLAWIALAPRFSLAMGSVVMMLWPVLGVPLVLAYRHRRVTSRDPRLEAMLRMLMLVLFAILMASQINIFSHLAMSLGLPLADRQLQAWDFALGFDWNGYAAAAGATPWQRALLEFAYLSGMKVALLVIPFVAISAGRHERVDEAMFLAFLSGMACVTISALLPTFGAWGTIATPGTKELYGGPFLQEMVAQLEALRGNEPIAFHLATMEGLANFPSFHTCLALIIIWCSRGRWFTVLPGAVAGLAIIAATPVFGGHYGVDLLGGIAVMSAAILLWRAITLKCWPGLSRSAFRHLVPDPFLWCILAALIAVNLTWLTLSPRIGLVPRPAALWPAVLLLLPAALIYLERRDVQADPPLRLLFAAMFVVIFGTLQLQQVVLFNQLAMSVVFPLVDAQAIAVDQALGFDWNAYVAAVGAVPAVRSVLHFAYFHAIDLALAVLLGLFVLQGRWQRVDEIAFLSLASGLICIVVSVVLPVLPAWETIATPATERALAGRMDHALVADLTALRGSAPVAIDPGTMLGLSGFPSFHTCLGIILIWCSRGSWMTALPGAVVGLAVLVATPVFGGHYGVDLLGGALVMAGVIPLWLWLAPALRRSPD